MKYDELIEHIGEFGRYQKLIFLLTCLPAISSAVQTLIIIFILAVPDHRCAIPGLDNDTYFIQSEVHWSLFNNTVWWAGADPSKVNNVWGSGHCYVLVNRTAKDIDTDRGNAPVSSTIVKCDKWTYDRSTFTETFVSQNNWVCDNRDLRSHSNMIHMAGVLIGSFVCGILSDSSHFFIMVIMLLVQPTEYKSYTKGATSFWMEFANPNKAVEELEPGPGNIILVLNLRYSRSGRKKTILLAIWIHVGASVGTAFAHNFSTFSILRFLTGIGNIGIYMCSFVLAVEFVGPGWRAQVGVSVNYAWCVGLFLLCGAAYGLRNWQTLQLVTGAASGILFPIWWFIPESPRWLLSKGRHKEARVILERISKHNKTVLPEYSVGEDKGDNSKNGLIDVFKHPVLVLRTVVVFMNWFVVTVVYDGLNYNVATLDGDIYVNFFLSSIVEVLAYTFCLVAVPRVGRKHVHCFAMFLNGVACLCFIIPTLFKLEGSWIFIFLSSVGKFGASSGFTTLFVLTAELFPTQLRNSMVGTSSMVARVGGMISPYIADLGILVGGQFGTALPFIVFGSCGILAGLITLLLPETLNQKLPETIEEAVRFGKNNKISSIDDASVSSTSKQSNSSTVDKTYESNGYKDSAIYTVNISCSGTEQTRINNH